MSTPGHRDNTAASVIGLQAHPEASLGQLSTQPESDTLHEAPENAQSAFLPVSRRTQLTVLACGFFDVFLTVGINQSYGVFLTQYIDSPNNPHDHFLPPDQVQNKALLAFIGTVAAGLTWGGSIVVNPIMARTKNPCYITLIGGCFIGLGYVLASFCSKAWQLLLTQGLMYGIGTSLLYFPVLAVAPEYFDSHRGLAVGFVISGGSCGGLVCAPTIRVMLSRIGTRWTLRTLGILNFLIALPISIYTPPPRIKSKRPTLVNSQIARRATFVLQAVAAMSQAAGNFVPLTFLPEFSTSLGYTAAFGAVLLAINNGLNAFSRIFMGFVGDFAGRQNTLIVTSIASALTVLAFWLVSATSNSTGPWIAFVIMYGLLGGGYASLFPTTVIEVFGRQAYASVNGFIYFVRGLGALWGSPVGGALLGNGGNSPESFVRLIYYDFALLMICGCSVLTVRILDARQKGEWKLKA